jgi:hypothetical protein
MVVLKINWNNEIVLPNSVPGTKKLYNKEKAITWGMNKFLNDLKIKSIFQSYSSLGSQQSIG